MPASVLLPESWWLVAIAAGAVGMLVVAWLAPRRGSAAALAALTGLGLLVAAGGLAAGGADAPWAGRLLVGATAVLSAAGALGVMETRARDRHARLATADLESARRDVDRLNGMNVRLEDEVQEARRRLRAGDEQRSGSGAMIEATMVRQRKALEAANALARRHRAVFEGVIEGMAILERETLRLVDVNPSLVRLTGVEAKALSEKSLLDLLADGPARPGKSDLLRCARERRPLAVVLAGSGGREVPAELTISVAGSGDDAQIVAVVRDVAERATAERDHQAALTAVRDRLLTAEGDAAEVAERNRQLEAANRRLTELNERRDQTLATVSHELRTPLTSIRSFSEILLAHDGTSADERREFLGIIHRESERLTRLVNNVLDLARIESGATRLLPSEFDARAVAEDAAAAARGVALERRVRIAVRAGAEPRPMRADRDRVQQTLTNLLANAVRHSPAESEVVLEVAGSDRPGRVRFVVSDRGSGVPADEVERVFDRFHRSEEDPAAAATGLGLAISKELVTLHGGRIWVENADGGGASFHAEFPAVDEVRTLVAQASRAGRDAPPARLPPVGSRPAPERAAQGADFSTTGSVRPIGRG